MHNLNYIMDWHTQYKYFEFYTFNYNFPNDQLDRYYYSHWILITGLHATRIVTPIEFITPLNLYKVLLGDDWHDFDKWPDWLKDELHLSGMHLDQLDWNDVLGLIDKGKIVLVSDERQPNLDT